MLCFFFECYGDHRDLHVLTHSFPTRRSSDLRVGAPLPDRLAGVEQRVLQRLDALLHRGDHLGESGENENLQKRSYMLPFLRSEEHTSELQSLMRISYAVFCLKKKNADEKYQK